MTGGTADPRRLPAPPAGSGLEATPAGPGVEATPAGRPVGAASPGHGVAAAWTRLQRQAYRTWARLPLFVRLFVIRRATPSFYVGAICVVERGDGALLLVRNAYRASWGFPGGFLKRGESPYDAARRETKEEVGIEVELDVNPKVVVDDRMRRVDVIFTGRVAESDSNEGIVPRSLEILEARWFPAIDLPDLQAEAVTALIELGRSHRPPVDRGSPGDPPLSG